MHAVLNLLREQGPMTVPQMSRAQALSRQFVQRMVNEAAARVGQVGGNLTDAEITACLRVLNHLLDFLGDDDLS